MISSRVLQIIKKCHLSFAFFLLYGIWNYGPNKFDFHKLITIDNINYVLFSGILTLFLYRILKYESKSIDHSIVGIQRKRLKQALIFTIFIIPILVIQNRHLVISDLTGDELAYSGNAISQSKKMGEQFLRLLGINNADIQVNSIISVGTIFFLLLILFLLFIFFKLVRSGKFIFAIVFFLLVRNSFAYFFKYSSIYLSGFLAPLTIGGIFPVSDLSMRIFQATFVVILTLFLLIQLKVFQELNFYQKLGLLLVLISTPYFSKNIFVIEPVIFYIVIGSIILLASISEERINYNVLFLTAIASFAFRPTAIVLLFFVIIKYFFDKDLHKTRIDFRPLFLFFPFLIELGTQSAYGQVLGTRFNNAPELTKSTNSFSAFIGTYVTSSTWLDLFMLLSSLLIFIISKRMRVLFLYLGLLVVLYIPLIPKGARGNNKYFIEALAPIIISGSLFLTLSLYRYKTPIFKLLVLGFLVLFSLNSFFSRVDISRNVSEFGQVRSLVGVPANYGNLRSHLLKSENNQKCFEVAVTYGNFNYVLSGSTVKQTSELDSSLNYFQSSINTQDFQSIVNSKASCLIVGNIHHRRELISLLTDENWTVDWSYHYSPTNSLVEIWVRK